MALGQDLKMALSEPPGGLEAGGPTVACRVAAVVWEDTQRRFQRYSSLVFVLALIALAGIVAAIVLFFVVDDATSGAVASLVAGLLSGALAKFIRDERDTARKDRDAAREILRKDCEGQTADGILATLRG
jgi:hypothetical protein